MKHRGAKKKHRHKMAVQLNKTIAKRGKSLGGHEYLIITEGCGIFATSIRKCYYGNGDATKKKKTVVKKPIYPKVRYMQVGLHNLRACLRIIELR